MSDYSYQVEFPREDGPVWVCRITKGSLIDQSPPPVPQLPIWRRLTRLEPSNDRARDFYCLLCGAKLGNDPRGARR